MGGTTEHDHEDEVRPLLKPGKKANKAERQRIRQRLEQLPGGGFGPHAAERSGLISRLNELFRSQGAK